MEKLKVLFIDDDLNLGNLISTVLESDYNFTVHFQNTLAGINYIIPSFEPDIIILDVEIGKDNGIDKAKDIIALYPNTPIIFVSSHTEDHLVTEGMNIGGHAYLAKPLSIPVLVSYINRFTRFEGRDNCINLAGYQLQLSNNELLFEGKIIKKLSLFEKNTLELLMKYPNQIISQERISQELWGEALLKSRTANIHNIISKLRDLFKTHNEVKINTVRGVGYMLEY